MSWWWWEGVRAEERKEERRVLERREDSERTRRLTFAGNGSCCGSRGQREQPGRLSGVPCIDNVKGRSKGNVKM